MKYKRSIKEGNLRIYFRKLKDKIKFIISIICVYKNQSLALLATFRLLRKKKIIYKMKNGVKYLARSEDIFVINDMYVNREYHKFLKKIQNNSVVIDIGAHIGVFSVLVTTLGKNIHVYSYEPSEENYRILERNIHLNNLHDVHAFKLAVGGKKGKRTLFIDENPAEHSFFFKKGKKVTVDTVALKDVLDYNKIVSCDLLKMDCEGAEYEILFNTPKNYLRKIKNICLEYHNNDNVKKLKIFLKDNGFNTVLNKKKTPIMFIKGRKSPSLLAEKENSLLFAERL